MLRRITSKIKGFYYQLVLAREDPKRIARGIAIGTFVAWSPLLGFHTILCLIMAFIFRASKTASIFGSLICNPITIPFILFIDYEIGIIFCKVFEMDYTHMILSDFKNINIIETGIEILVPAILGSVVLGILFAIPSYFISKNYFTRIFNEQKKLS